MDNTIITPTWVLKDTAVAWKNHIKLVANFDRQYDAAWRDLPKGAKIGDTCQARLPWRPLVSEGQAFVPQPIVNQTVPISVNHQYQEGMNWSSADSALRIEEVQERYTMPCGRAMASKADVQAGVGWPLSRRARLADVAPPSGPELRLLREVLDPKKLYLKG